MKIENGMIRGNPGEPYNPQLRSNYSQRILEKTERLLKPEREPERESEIRATEAETVIETVIENSTSETVEIVEAVEFYDGFEPLELETYGAEFEQIGSMSSADDYENLL